MKTNERLLDLLLEIQILDRVPRMGYLLRGISDPESISEHSFQVGFLVWVMARRIEGVDVRRAMEIALIHDVAELRTGDLPMTAGRYLPAGAKKLAEAAALREILAPLGDEALTLAAEYEAQEIPEARLVKACDKLQLMLKVTLYEDWGAGGLAEFWDNEANFPDGGFPEIREVFEQLRQRRDRAD